MIRNPILPGFNPDPSICRVGDEYYIATSTFEWYPGVQIHRSRDLVNWQLAARPLTRAAQLDMRGNPDSCGIWAPCLSYADDRFWLVYTDVKRYDGNFKDTHNYIVTCETVDGVWSDPVHVNSSGFDPSLFHDDDGRKWFANLQWNHRGPGTGGNPAHASFDGILLQQYDAGAGRLIGAPRVVFHGSDLGLTEGPHLFKRNGWYYLTVAEGGTGYSHAVTMARARTIDGPYELHPQKHLLTAMDAPDHPLQRVGHGQYVETPEGVPYHTFLCSRPLPGRRSPLGRETGIERCVWKEDGWLYSESGDPAPRQEVPAPVHGPSRAPPRPLDRRFDGATLPPEFQWLRTPEADRIFELRDGQLRLVGRESIGSWFEQALVARRQEHLRYAAETTVEFEPVTYQQAAGLTTYYNRHKFHFLALTHDADAGRCLSLVSCLGDWPECALTKHLDAPVSVSTGPIEMRVEVDRAEQRFFWRQDGGDWRPIGPALDASLISDEAGRGEHASFTGAFVGLVCFDITGGGRSAAFDHFFYDPTFGTPASPA